MFFARLKKILSYSPFQLFAAVLYHVPWIVTDKFYVKIQYRARLGVFPNLKNPQSYTEKLQWLKLYDHNPAYTNLVDKVLVKDIVAKQIGTEHIIRTLGVWDNPDDIDFDKLPNRFVLKCNHTGGGVVFICKDKNQFDFEQVKIKLAKLLKTDVFYKTREWPYKDIERKILCEEFLDDGTGGLIDYKFHCSDGEIRYMFVASDRFTDLHYNLYDVDFKPLSITSARKSNSQTVFDKPAEFEEMKLIALKLCQGFPHVRVDLYCCNHVIYFGELTFYDASGFDDNNSAEWNNLKGSWITLPKKIKNL